MLQRARLAVGLVATCPPVSPEELRDGDRQVARNRILFGLGAAAYTWFVSIKGDLDTPVPIIVNTIYLVIAVCVLFSTRLSAKKLNVCRTVMLVIDVSALSVALIAAGPVAAPVLFLYLWLIIGYGFRYGIFYLRLAAIVSLGGILLALLFTDFWHTQPFVAAGVLMLAVIVPPYLELLMRRATRANETAKHANSSKALMLAGLGHTLRVPLNSILAAAQTMSDSALDLMQTQTIAAIQAAAGSLIRELDDLTDVSRLDAGRMPKEITSFSVKGLIAEALAIASVQATPKNIAVNWYISPEVPERIWSERRYLLKSLTNIIENAVKFTSIGSVLISAYVKDGPTTKAWLYFEVLDTGIGIQSEVRSRIFESFSQASPEIYHIFGGAGLGLSVAKRMLEMLGGQVGVDSLEGQGARFWLKVPVVAATARELSHRDLAGTTIVILTSHVADLLPFAERLETLGATTFLSEQSDWSDEISAEKVCQAERTVVIVDGRYTNLAELGKVLQEGLLLDRVLMIALTKQSTLPAPAIRRRFVTAITLDVSDEHLLSSLHLVGAFKQDPKMRDKQPPRSRDPSASTPVGRSRVLIVDTNQTTVLILSKILEQGGYSWLVVESGDCALDMAERELFDVVFMDVDKPAVDGLEAVKMLRFQELGTHRNTVIGLTSYDDLPTVVRCREAGCDSIILQPLDSKKVLDLVANSIAKRPHDVSATQQAADVIRPISSHPRFRVSPGPAIVDASFHYLRSIGGALFVQEVTELFISDSERTLVKLTDALERDNLDSFRNGVVSLGESAAVIGAEKLAGMCKKAGIFAKERMTLGERALLSSLRSEVSRVVGEVRGYLPPGAEPPNPTPNDRQPGNS